jgi:DNA-binding LytR/AlgR family response regulator
MIKAIALDDEPLALGIIEKFCAKAGEIELLRTFTKPNEAELFLRTNEVDIIFLDIQMPTKTGIDFARNLSNSTHIIFTTAFSEFAVEGFNLEASDYLLKPFSYARFEQAIKKTIQLIKLKSKAKDEGEKVLQIKADYTLYHINYKDILYFEGFDDYVKIHLQQQKSIVARITLKSLTEKFTSDYFIRVHRSFIVPFHRITSYRNKHLTVADKLIPVGGAYQLIVEEQLQKAT